MKLTVISDTHTRHRELELPGGDVLIHAGDFMGSGYIVDELIDFLKWLEEQPYKHKIFIAGNHDRMFEDDPSYTEDILRHFDESVIYLQDDSCTIDGINFYGSPWTLEFMGWAFQIHNHYEDAEHWRKIPKDTDVLITHGPAYGWLDQVERSPGQLSEHLGSKELHNWIDHNNPTLHICGHIHSAQGVLDGYNETTTHINASCLGEDYKYSHNKNYIEWEL